MYCSNRKSFDNGDDACLYNALTNTATDTDATKYMHANNPAIDRAPSMHGHVMS
jgi:hypothetical protein